MTTQEADTGDSQSLPSTLERAEESLVAIREPEAREQRPESGIEEVVTDKGYHSDEILVKYAEQGIRTYISEPKQKRNWKGKEKQKRATQSNRRSIRGERGKELLRRQGELVERPFAHRMDRGRLRRLHVGGTSNVAKQELLLCAAQNLGLLMRAVYGAGTPRRRAAHGRPSSTTATGLLGTLLVLLSALWRQLSMLWAPRWQAGPAWQLGYAG